MPFFPIDDTPSSTFGDDCDVDYDQELRNAYLRIVECSEDCRPLEYHSQIAPYCGPLDVNDVNEASIIHSSEAGLEDGTSSEESFDERGSWDYSDAAAAANEYGSRCASPMSYQTTDLDVKTYGTVFHLPVVSN
jgi:hypothetical protein